MSTNPLIQDLIENEAFPSVSVALPTGGRWYKDDVLMAGIDPLDVPVGVLGILAEQNYRDPWLMLSGEAIPRMLKGVCPAVTKAADLCEIDLEAILLAARLVSYGPKLELHHTCHNTVKKTPEEIKDEKARVEAEGTVLKSEENPDGHEIATTRSCGHKNTITLDLNEHILRYDVFTDETVEEKFTYHLKRVNQTVHLRPAAYSRIIGQMRESLARDKQIRSFDDLQIDDMVVNPEAMGRYARIIDMASETALENIEASIYAIATSDGTLVDGEDFIREWLLALSADEAEGISGRINEISRWLLSFSDIKYNCGACEAGQSFRLELDANRLFGQAGDSTQPKKLSPKSKSGAKKRRIR